MRFISLTVTSLLKKEIKNYFKFNPVGLNLILGEKNDENDETNGVGKTALVESIQYCLGANLPKSFKGKQALLEEDIFIVLAVEYNNKITSIGRQLGDDSFAYMLDSETIQFELSLWDAFNKDDFRKYIQNIIFSEFKNINTATAPSFASLREYIIRDEKTGFTGIEIKGRKSAAVNQVISFLSLLPCFYENNLLQQKNIIKDFENQLKEIKAIGKDIEKIRSSYQTTIEEIDKLKKVLNDANVSEKLNNDEDEYYILKSRLNETYLQIRKFEFAQRQHQANIQDLEDNLNKIKEFIDLEEFYKKTLGYFPDVIVKNYEDMHTFYQFMIGNRGEYIRKQLEIVENKLAPLYAQREELLDRLSTNTHFAKNSTLIKDLQDISNQIAEKYKIVAEYNYKIELYSRKASVENDKKKQCGIMETLTAKYKADFDNHKIQIENIISHFQKLNQTTYQANGILSYEFEESLKSNSATGRIKINCSIEDENAHGRFLMKINMFDLALMLNRIDHEQGILFLFHDGSYSKPAPAIKEKLLTYVDAYLKKKGLGQYFVTINVEEISPEAMDSFSKNKNIVTRLQRTDSNVDRFMGMKY